MAEKIVEIGVGPRSDRCWTSTISEQASVRRNSVAMCVAKHLPAIELVQSERANSPRKTYRASPEEFLELLHDAKYADFFMLPQIVHVADSNDAFGSDCVVVCDNARWYARRAEIRRRVRTHTRKCRETL